MNQQHHKLHFNHKKLYCLCKAPINQDKVEQDLIPVTNGVKLEGF